ncbi:sensor histidine kinase [Dinghuibacter silviterrae]|uniref:histidine kinase n=1 Tax=Dinghuibacter silviterrae TaxID=1539049 RepID=A0A4V3GM20_9BACT|nr:HAMP domain-containing sensor histidine kinase [Dinghuibacter silviterrae]TDX01763.1 phospho-acceptor domain-containing protein [Dinghuibacter silviterrae]
MQNPTPEAVLLEPSAPPVLRHILLQTLSHELRTPFSIIQTSAELLVLLQTRLTGEDKDLVGEHAQAILSEITHVTDVINRMVHFSRWEPGEIPPVADPSNILIATREELAKDFHPWKDGRRAELKVTGKPRLVRIDPALFQLVLRNLVENAFKYSPGKKAPIVELRFGEEVWGLQVKDHGIGIPEEDLDRLFQPFERGSNVGNTPGMGLGLRIAHYLVNNFYGTLSIESGRGKGTTATVTFLYR